ncbi:MAG: hypothetical protein IKU34_08990 [Clostridia bacterium]|nr:hypothetical protein [Clostridia bacterium]
MNKLRAVLTPQVLLLLILMMAAFVMLTGPERSEQSDLEKRIADTLSAVDGVGKVRVVIATRTEKTESGVGLSSGQPKQIPCGAVAVAEGAENPWIQAQLIDALCALLGLPASAVSVISGGNSR